MASVREKIKMTSAEIDAFLAEPHKLQLGTINPDGTPHLVTMYYAVFDSRIGFWTYRTSQKARNLERDPRLTCLVEAGEGYDELHGVQINGRVSVITDEARIRDIGETVYGRYAGEMADSLGGFLDQQARKRYAYLVEPSKISSWDHRKLAAAYAAG